MKQVQYSAQIIPVLFFDENTDSTSTTSGISDETKLQLLATQLSHSDGIRGFMVSYLTMESSHDDTSVPKLLQDAMAKVTNRKDLVLLACEYSHSYLAKSNRLVFFLL